MDSYARWRAEVEAALEGRSFEDTLVTKTHDGVRIEPLYPDAPRRPPLPGRWALAPETGGILGAGEPAPEGSSLAWWLGVPGVHAASIGGIVVESDDEGGVPVELDHEALDHVVVGTRPRPGGRLASPAGLAAAEEGGGPVAELAAVFVGLGRALDGGADPKELAVAVSMSGDFFVDIAKIRALRRGVLGMLHAAGHGVRCIPLAARQTLRSVSNVDVETNAIRGAIACAAGVIAGADYVGIFAHDVATGAPSDAAKRLAWTQGQVLTRESHLHLLDDASEGSPFVEALTDQLGEAAWRLARQVLGGDRDALRLRIEQDAEARGAALRTRRKPLVGASRFVGRATVVGSPARDAFVFEQLRERGTGKKGVVVAVGDRKLDARVDFAREVLELAGLEVEPPARASDAAAALAGVRISTGLAIVATADAALATHAVELAASLSQRGLVVLCAGRPGAVEAALRAAGVRGFVYQGSDVVELLSSVLTAPGGGAS